LETWNFKFIFLNSTSPKIPGRVRKLYIKHREDGENGKTTKINPNGIVLPDLSAYLQRYSCNKVPLIYSPLDLRGKVTFQSLVGHTFTEQEKVWLCDYIAENTSALM
jgi:hypothetical protein